MRCLPLCRIGVLVLGALVGCKPGTGDSSAASGGTGGGSAPSDAAARGGAGSGGQAAGTGGGGGAAGTGGSTAADCSPACTPDEVCVGGSCVASTWGGMTCTTTEECPSYARCCDGSDETCDGSRLPAGDGANADEFEVSADGTTVKDVITGVVWQRGDRDGRTWAEAKAYCASLTLGGASGWRLPSVLELLTVLDLRQGAGVLPAAFPSCALTPHWTSTPEAGHPGYAWTVDLSDGTSWPQDTDNTLQRVVTVRCVH